MVINKRKKIFILEDGADRRNWFRANLYPQYGGLSFAENLEEARECLIHRAYDVIFLDHDLKPEHYRAYHPTIASTQFDEESGYAVAKLLRFSNYSPEAEIIIHTMNAPQAMRMRNLLLLRRSVHAPRIAVFGTPLFLEYTAQFKGDS